MNWFDELKKWLGTTFGGQQKPQPPKPAPKPIQQPSFSVQKTLQPLNQPTNPAQPKAAVQPKLPSIVAPKDFATPQKSPADLEWQKGYDFAKQHGKSHEEAMQVGHTYKNAFTAKTRADNMKTTAKIVNAPITVAKGVGRAAADIIPNTIDNTKEFAGNAITAIDKNNQLGKDLVRSGRAGKEATAKRFDFLNKGEYDFGKLHDISGSVTNLAADIALTRGAATLGMAPKLAAPLATRGQKIATAALNTVRNPANVAAGRHYTENANDITQDAENHGVSHRDAFLKGNMSAAAQLGVERVALNKHAQPGGTRLQNMVRGFRTEGREEATQKLIENATRKTYKDQNLLDGVAEASVMGGVIGAGASGLASPVSKAMPKNEAEHRHAVENGIVTPATKHASYEDKLETARNSDLAPQNQTGLRRAQGGPSLVMPKQSTQASVQPNTPQDTSVRYKLNPKHAAEVRAYNEHIGLLRQQESNLLEQGLSENSAPVINNRKAQAEAIKARDNVGKLDERGVRYRIAQDNNGAYVKGEYSPEFKSNDIAKLQRAAKAYNNNLYKSDTPIANIDGVDVSVMKDSGGKWAYYNPEMKSNRRITVDKLKMTPHQREMIEAAQWNLDSDGNPRLSINKNKDSHPGVEYWAYGVTRFESPNSNQQYTGIVNLGYDSEYQPVYYTIDKIKELPLPPSKEVKNYGGSSDTHTIADETENVNPSVRYSINQAQRRLQKMNDLLARHLHLTGDERVVFNEWRNEMEREAAGYYDPKTDKINLNDLTLDTLNHEIAHKVLQRSQKSQQLIAEVRRRVGDDALIARYGDEYGTSDVDLLAEEYIADGFAEYYNGKLLGESDQRLASRLGIPPRLVAIYDRIAQALRSLIGKRNSILEFYEEIETGKYRNKQLAGNPLGLQPAYKLEDTLRGFDNSSNHTPVAKIGDVEVVLGDYGRNAASRKSGKIVNDVKYRRKAVSKEELTSEALAPYSLKLTKTDINNAIDEVIGIKYPELIEQQIKLEEELNAIEDRDALGVAGGTLRPEDAKHYLGKEYRQFVPAGYIRKDALPVDIQAQERGFDSVDDYIEHVIRPLQVRKEMTELKKEIETLQNNPDIRAEAKDLAEAYVYEKAEREIGYDELEKRAARHERKAEETARKAAYKEKYKDKLDSKTLERARDIARYRLSQGEQHTLVDVVSYIAKQTGITQKQASAIVKKEAKLANIDISGERARKIRITQDVPILIDENGEHIPLDKMVPDEKTLQKLKDMKPGVEVAVAKSMGDEKMQALEEKTGHRQMMYKNEDGTFSTFYAYKNSKGKWQSIGAAAVQLKSPLQDAVIKEMADDATLNREAKRAKLEGRGTQYIWNEAPDGHSAELLAEFGTERKDAGNKGSSSYREASALVQYDPDIHHIEKGRVVDNRTGKILGNYIEISDKGEVITYAGNKMISLQATDIDWTAIRDLWTSGNTWTTEGVIQRMTGALRGANSAKYFKNANKTAETLYYIMIEIPRRALRAAMQEAKAIGDQINFYEKNLHKAIKKYPWWKRKQILQAAVYVIEPARPKNGETVPEYEERLAEFRRLYGDEAADALHVYRGYIRALYKNLLLRQNEVRRRLGKELIKERKDYLTHINEMSQGGLGNLLNGVKNLMSSGEVMDSGRGKLPAKIAGKTDVFKPLQKFMPFANERVSDTKPTNPFDPVRVYAKAALPNIHMTDAITMNRALEVTVRSLSEFKAEAHHIGPRGIEAIADMFDEVKNEVEAGTANIESVRTITNKVYGLQKAVGGEISGYDELNRLTNRIAYRQKHRKKVSQKDWRALYGNIEKVQQSLEKVANNAELLQQITNAANGLGGFTQFVMEHTNRLAGKTDPHLRLVKDEGKDGAALSLSVLRLAQKQAALSRIVGSASSALAQGLSLAQLIATTKPSAMIQALWTSRDIVNQSDAMVVRYTENTLDKVTKFDKMMKVGGKPMELVERNVMKYEFVAKYLDGKKKGLSEEDALKYAERFIGDTVTFRDAISTPRIYNRPMGALLQFTREVTQGNRFAFYQMDKVQQAAYFTAIVPIMYTLYEAITGVKPGMNIVGAIVGAMLSDDDDDEVEKYSEEWFLRKTLKASQNISAELIAGIPVANAIANFGLTQEDRKLLFGTDSSLGRYSGQAAALGASGALLKYFRTMNQVNEKDDSGLDKYTEEEKEAMRKSARLYLLRELPMGSQIRKSIQGIDAMSQGYVEDSKGRPVANIQSTDNPLAWTQAALFGPNALYEAQAKRGENALINFIKGDGDVASAASGPTLTPTKELQKLERTRDKGEKKGEWKRNESGVWTDKDGDVKRDYYKDRARITESQGIRNEDTYFAYLHGYGLEKGTKYDKNTDEKVDTGDKLLDTLLNADNEKSSEGMANRAIELLSDKKKYKNVPDWVKEKFYQEAGFTKKDVSYGALAKVKTETKVDLLYRPLANNPEQLVHTLNQHRKKGINGHMIATNAVIDQLRREGLIDKNTAKALKSVEYTRGEGGSWSNSKASQSSSGGGSRRSGSRYGGRSFSSEDIRRFMGKGTGSMNRYAVMPSTGTSIRMRSPRLKSLRNRRLATIRNGKVASRVKLG